MVIWAIHGADRKVGSIGNFEPFWIEVEADSKFTAQQEARRQRYADGREHVHLASTEEIQP